MRIVTQPQVTKPSPPDAWIFVKATLAAAIAALIAFKLSRHWGVTTAVFILVWLLAWEVGRD